MENEVLLKANTDLQGIRVLDLSRSPWACLYLVPTEYGCRSRPCGTQTRGFDSIYSLLYEWALTIVLLVLEKIHGSDSRNENFSGNDQSNDSLL